MTTPLDVWLNAGVLLAACGAAFYLSLMPWRDE